MSDLSKRIASLTPEKRDLLLNQLEERQTSNAQKNIRPYTRKSNNFPVSFAQEQLWLLAQLEEAMGAAYHIPQAYRLQGSIDISTLEKSLNEIVSRHEALRTHFATKKGHLYQKILPSSPLKLPIIKLQATSLREQGANLRQLLSEEAQRPFNLETGPLLRAALFQRDIVDHVLLVTIHHIAFDGWSMILFWRELVELYSAYMAGATTSTLPLLSIQYVDYAQWQRDQLKDEVMVQQLKYWKKQLAGIPPMLPLPIDNPRPAIRTFRGATYIFNLPPELSEPLETLSHQEEATLFMTLLAAFKVLLHRYTSQTDIIVGTPVTNRRRVEFEGLIGFFVNTLVLRTDMSGILTFRDMLRRVRKVALGAYSHQDVPFSHLVQTLQPERNTSHSPLFQVMFVLQNEPVSLPELPGLNVESVAVEREHVQYDLGLQLTETKQGLTGRLEYNTDLFTKETMIRLTGHLTQLLTGIIANPDQLIGFLPLLTHAERHQMLVEWNDTQQDYPQNMCIHRLFEKQVEQTPEAIAVFFEKQKLTYRELNQRANQLAHHLRKLGVGSETLVGVCIERSIDLVVGILGILKAGGAYVPLDPNYPKEHLSVILEDTQATVLVTQAHLQFSLPKSPQTQLVYLDNQWGEIVGNSALNLKHEFATQSLAYVIYTSGSTGKPKGVAVTHQNAVALLTWAAAIFVPEELKGVLTATSICFDLSIYELFLTLSQGGTIILAQDALHLLSIPARESVTLINTVPSVMSELVRTQAIPGSVKTVNLAGEPLKRILAQQVYKHTNVQRIYNLYGPSEDTTYSTFALVQREELNEPTIGRPIENTQAYILDDNLQPIPSGLIGELYLGGAGVSRGYLNQPSKTSERYLPDPFSSKRGARLYKTGDRVRYLPDGRIVFLGRTDRQVKIRGYRIEIGEVEFALEQHRSVHKSAVIVQEDKIGNKVLTAYIVATKDRKIPDSDELRKFMQKKLPTYMIPSRFYFLDALPLTSNGKTNYRALSIRNAFHPVHSESTSMLDNKAENEIQSNVLGLDQVRVSYRSKYVAPRNAQEYQIAHIWEDILKVELVGIKDDFFSLGGHSLLVVYLLDYIKKIFNHRVSLSEFLQEPTVDYMARLLRQAQQDAKDFSCVVPITTHFNAQKAPFFCVHSAEGHILPYIKLANYLGKNQPFYGLQALGLREDTQPHDKIETMASHYIESIQKIQPHGPYIVGGWCIGGIIAYEMAQQLQKQGEEVALIALIDSVAPPITGWSTHGSNDPQFFASLGIDIGRFLGVDLPLTPDYFQGYNENERWYRLLYYLQKANMLPFDARVTYLQRLTKLRIPNSYALEHYQPDPAQTLLTKVALFYALDHGKHHEHNYERHPTLHWDKYVSEECLTVYPVPGDHTEIIIEPNVQILAQSMKQCFKKIYQEISKPIFINSTHRLAKTKY